MDKIPESVVLTLAVLGFVAWLGGGRKWAFRTLLSFLILAGLIVGGIFLYAYGTDKVAEHRRNRLHACAVAKIADPKCIPVPKGSAFPEGALECPIYSLPDNPTPEQEESALATAEEECRAELDPSQRSLHEQISQYRREHGIRESGVKWDGPKGDVFDQAAAQNPTGHKRLNAKACAAKVRNFYPNDYNDMDDVTLTRKVLAKYPTYCDITPGTPDFIPAINGIR